MGAGNLLLVDETREVVELLTIALKNAGYEVTPAYDPDSATRIVRRDHPDLAIIDSNLGRWSGLDLLRQIRVSSSMPVIILTAGDAAQERAVCMALGASDCVAKPVSQRQLLTAIRRNLSRASSQRANAGGVVRTKELALDLDGGFVMAGGKRVNLSAVECRVLECLMRHANTRLAVRELAELVWGPGTEATTFARAALSGLRQKLEREAQTAGLLVVDREACRLSASVA